MKTKAILLAMALGASTCHLTAQNGNEPAKGQQLAPSKGCLADDRHGGPPTETQVLTDAQKGQVKATLSKYDTSTLTADQAKAIHEAFRQAGLRGGPAMADTIKAAGFDPDKLRDLAPPPGQSQDNKDRQGGPARGGARAGRRGSDPAQGGAERRESQGRQPAGEGAYSIEQAISERAQLNTIAFDGLAFLTGDFGCNTFVPPGKVAVFGVDRQL